MVDFLSDTSTSYAFPKRTYVNIYKLMKTMMLAYYV
jgi:hypothetical protein